MSECFHVLLLTFLSQNKTSSQGDHLEKGMSRSIGKKQRLGLWKIFGFSWFVAATSISTLMESRIQNFDVSLEVSVFKTFLPDTL